MKQYKLIIALVAISTALTLSGQTTAMPASSLSSGEGGGRGLPSILDSIAANNTTLIALRSEAEARKLEHRTGITLDDPEVGLKRMWEGAEETGNLTELTVTQRVDLTTALGYRTRVARQQDQLVDEEYRMARMEILLEAQLTCIDIAYYNALAAELERRLGYARRVVEVEQARLECGDTDALSYNNVLLSLSALEAEKARVEMERNVLITHLTALNGGQGLECMATLADKGNRESITDVDFSAWYADAEHHLPQLAQARQLREVRRDELALAKSMYLPTLSATYVNERHTIGSRSQGVAIGVSIPLWANKNRVRSARTALETAEHLESDATLQLRSTFEQEFVRVKGLYHTAQLYRRALDEANNSELLEKAMDEGFISVLEYLQGIELYYDYLDRSLNAERDYRRALAELEAWRL